MSQKWAILYLLHQLADSDDSDDDSSRSENSRLQQGRPAQKDGKSVATYQDVSDPGDLNEAFATGGLPRLPARDRGSQDNPPTTRQIERPEQTGMQKAVVVEGDSMDPGKARMTMVAESALLRDLPFTFQGLSSVNFTFTSLSTLTLPANLPLPLVSILHDLAEPSLLYRNLSAFVESGDEGLIGQSLRSALGNELRSYLHLIAMIEGEIRRACSSAEVNEINPGVGKAGVTLRRCLVWMREPTTRLRLMSFMVEEAKSKPLLGDFVFPWLIQYRQERRPNNNNDTWIFYFSWGPLCWRFCRTHAGSCDPTILRYVAAVDI